MSGLRDARSLVHEKGRDPVAWTRAVRLLKTVVAAVAAWIVATEVFALPQPFLAPWAALLVVHATVYRTFSVGAQQVGATVLGVVLASVVGHTLGLDPAAIAVLLVLGMLAGQLPWIGAEGATVATTALIVLTTGYSDDGDFLLLRLADTAVGVAAGLAVNLLVWPPLLDRSAARAVNAIDDRLGSLLCDIAAGIRDGEGSTDRIAGWVKRAGKLDEEINRAWGLVRQARDSARLNPRRGARAMREPGEFDDLLHRIEQSLADTRSMVRTLGHSVSEVNAWDPVFRERWVRLLHDTGAAIMAPDAARVEQVREQLRELTGELSTEGLPSLHWPEYGGLIVSLRNIVTSMDEVARSNPVEVDRGRPMLRG